MLLSPFLLFLVTQHQEQMDRPAPRKWFNNRVNPPSTQDQAFRPKGLLNRDYEKCLCLVVNLRFTMKHTVNPSFPENLQT